MEIRKSVEISVVILFNGKDKYLREALESVKDFPEILVLAPDPEDLGAGIKSIKYEWEDSFSKARNRGHELASNPWILHLDSDEKLMTSREEIERVIDNTERGILNVVLNQGEQEVLKPRLMLRDSKWIRRSSEIPLHPKGQARAGNIKIQHVPLTDEEKKEKHNYNFSLLEKEYNEIGDPDLLFLCAIEKSFFDPESAKIYATKYVNKFNYKQHGKLRTQYLLMKYLIAFIDFNSQEEHSNSIRILKELLCTAPEYCEFWCLLGDIYLRMEELELCKEMFENAFRFSELGPSPHNRVWCDISKYGSYPRERLKVIYRVLSLKRNNKPFKLEFVPQP